MGLAKLSQIEDGIHQGTLENQALSQSADLLMTVFLRQLFYSAFERVRGLLEEAVNGG